MVYEGKLIGRGLEETLKSIGSRKYLGRFAQAYGKMSHGKAVSFVQKITSGENAKKAHDAMFGYLLAGKI